MTASRRSTKDGGYIGIDQSESTVQFSLELATKAEKERAELLLRSVCAEIEKKEGLSFEELKQILEPSYVPTDNMFDTLETCWQRDIIKSKNDEFYGFEIYTLSFIDRFLLTWWWTEFVISEQTHLKCIIIILKRKKICPICGLMGFLNGMKLQYPNRSDIKINPVSHALVEATVMSLDNPNQKNSDGFDLFRSIFYATDPHALQYCLHVKYNKEPEILDDTQTDDSEDQEGKDPDKNTKKGKGRDMDSDEEKPNSPSYIVVPHIEDTEITPPKDIVSIVTKAKTKPDLVMHTAMIQRVQIQTEGEQGGAVVNSQDMENMEVLVLSLEDCIEGLVDGLCPMWVVLNEGVWVRKVVVSHGSKKKEHSHSWQWIPFQEKVQNKYKDPNTLRMTAIFTNKNPDNSIKGIINNGPEPAYFKSIGIITPSRMKKIFEYWLVELEKWRDTLRKREIDRGCELAIGRINKMISWKPSELNIENRISSAHYQIFAAAGDIKTLSKSSTKEQKLTDLIVRETICLVAEQIQHCPSRINLLFHHYRSQENITITEEEANILFPNDTSQVVERLNVSSSSISNQQHLQEPLLPKYVEFFKKRMEYTPKSLCKTHKYLQQTLDLDFIKTGLKEFKADKINFDDIDDCGKWDKPLQKTYQEPFSVIVLIFIFVRYIPEILIFKLWSVMFLYAMAQNFSFSSELVQLYMAMDVSVLLFFWLGSWIIRFFSMCSFSPCGCFAFLHMCPPPKYCGCSALIVRNIIDTAVALGTVGVIVVLCVTESNGPLTPTSILNTLESMAIYYFPIRIFIAFCNHVLMPMTPTDITRKKLSTHMRKKERSPIRGVLKRSMMRVVFMILFVLFTGVYEYYLIVLQFDTLTKGVFCGNREHQLTAWDFFDSQWVICDVSTIMLWIVTLSGLLIDNGLAFTLLMSLFGFFHGIRRQGDARSAVRISKPELLENIAERFFRNKADPERERLSKRVWSWCLKSWRKQDLISDSEMKVLDEAVIDITSVNSLQARENIGFWINSLRLDPIDSPEKFIDIPSTTILIPVYEEKLEFTWKDSHSAPYYSIDEARYLLAKYTHHWLNLMERLKKKKNKGGVKDTGPKISNINKWLSMHDQLVYRTVKGAASYYKALIFLAKLEGKDKVTAKNEAMKKIEIVLCFQIYQKRYLEDAQIVNAWITKWPFLKVVFDWQRQKNMPPMLGNLENFPLPYDHASCCLRMMENGKIGLEVHPRENPLLLQNSRGRLQGKAMNQLNGMMFTTSQFVQVLDANQGGQATEYMKFPALLENFKLSSNPRETTIRRRIIGSREYIFTGPLSTVASFHAYQEWSFGTLVLRVYSDLGIRLHYGHPDVIHGPWAWAHSGLSKVNPEINTSEDVFAGFETMKCKERTKHVEHIQFEKGRETGLANMSSFDSKISAGNSGLLRSRDVAHLMERLPFLKRFLFFFGISGHFLTNSMMVISMQWYIWSLFLFSMAGASLQAVGGTIFSTEWILHAGFTAVIPLFAELLVERGTLIGILDALIFIPISTICYLFQMQTKHKAFAEGITTGKAAHISTGRGLQIYRKPLTSLYMDYAQTHYFAVINIIATTFAYWCIAHDLGGGSLPLIMIYIFCFCVLISPQLFNPTLKGNTFFELIEDGMRFVTWVGRPTTRITYNDWLDNLKYIKNNQNHDKEDFVRFWAQKDTSYLPSNIRDAIRMMFLQLFIGFGIWVFVTIFLLYPSMQFWFGSFVIYWLVFTIVNWFFLFFAPLRPYHAPAQMILYLLILIAFVVDLVLYSAQRVIPWSNIYIAFFIFVKELQYFRSFLFYMVALAAYIRQPVSHDETADEKEKRSAYIIFNIVVINELFMVNFMRVSVAVAWGLLSLLVGLVMRPLWANLFLFGKNTGLEKHLNIVVGNKPFKIQMYDFKKIQDSYLVLDKLFVAFNKGEISESEFKEKKIELSRLQIEEAGVNK